MKKREEKAIKKISLKFVVFIFFLLFLIFSGISIKKSFIFSRPDRINIFKYDDDATLYSLSTKDSSHYVIKFNSNLKLLIPGGYGYYRVGALGKLVKLEKNNDIFIRTISYSTSSFIDRYFYPRRVSIYYKSENDKDIKMLGLKEILFYKSNSSVWDKLYLLWKFFIIEKNKISNLEVFEKDNINKELFFDKDKFDEKYKGLFYQKTYRDENKTVQILYSKDYNSAFIIGQILEGVGIRVVDISQKEPLSKNCAVWENSKKFSKTIMNLASRFHCSLKIRKLNFLI
jgi:hypothetical protein